MQHSFKDTTVSGVKWSVIGRIGQNIIVFVIGVVLARLLSPAEFGLLGMIGVIVGFAKIFTELGFGAALIQKKEISQEELSSVFWLNLAGGTLLTVLFIVLAPAIARFYQTPELRLITAFISFNFLISSVVIIQNTLLTKEINFKYISYIEILANLIAGSVAIYMAAVGYGVWSLVAQSLLISVTTAALMWFFSSWRPSFTFRIGAIKALLKFSLNHLGNRSMNYWARNLDNLLIGKFLGSGSLGVYSKSYAIMLLPLQNVSHVLSRVMFPALSKIQDDREKVRQVFLRITRVIALITFPMMTGLFVVVEPFVLVVFGEQWSGMIPILQVLCLVGMIQSIGTLNGNLYLSQGRADLQFRVGIVLKAVVFIGIVTGIKWGVLGVAIGYATASAINSYPSFKFAGRLVGLTYRDLLKNLKSTFFISVVMAVIVWGVGYFIPVSWPLWLLLVLQVLLGIILYSAFVYFLKPPSYVDLRGLIFEQINKRKVEVQ